MKLKSISDICLRIILCTRICPLLTFWTSVPVSGYWKSRIPGRVAEMIRQQDWTGKNIRKLGELSKGYQQRVGLAQANNSQSRNINSWMKPTSGLDPNQIAEIRKTNPWTWPWKNCHSKYTYSSWGWSNLRQDFFIINKGKFVADGTAETLRKQAQGSDILRVKIEDGEPNQIFKSLQSLKSVSMIEFADRKLNLFNIHCSTMEVKREIFKLCVDKKLGAHRTDFFWNKTWRYLQRFNNE